MFNIEKLFKKPEANLGEVVFNRSPQANSRIYISVSALALLIFLAIALNFPIRDMFLKRFFPKPPSQAAGNFTISGNVFLDINSDGTQDNGEVGGSYVPVSLTGPTSVATYSSELGDYSISDLPAGTYTATSSLSTGFTVTTGNKSNSIGNLTIDAANPEATANFGLSWVPKGIADPACTVQSIVPYQSGTTPFTPTPLAGYFDIINGKGIYVFTSPALPPITPPPSWSGINQLYTQQGASPICLSCNTPAPGSLQPNLDRFKEHPVWRPQGDWIIVPAEMDGYPTVYEATASSTLKEEENNNYWSNIYAVKPDGSAWYQLTNYTMPNTPAPMFGTLAPSFSPDGNKVAWSEIYRLPDTQHPEGYWKLYIADFSVDSNGLPSLLNIQDLTQSNGFLYEVHTWSLDSSTLIFGADIGISNVYGWDEFSYNINTHMLTDLNNSPDQWDEHARISPSGKKIAWSTSSPYPSLLPEYGSLIYTQFLSILKMEVAVMDTNGNNQQQITYYNTPAPPGIPNPEYLPNAVSLSQVPIWSIDGKQLRVDQNIIDPSTGYLGQDKIWIVTFSGNCGGNTSSPTPTVTSFPTSTPTPTPIGIGGGPTPTQTPIPTSTLTPTSTSIPSITPSITVTLSNGDLDHDGKVDLTDLSILLSDFNTNQSFDLDGDNVINSIDFGVMLTDLKNAGVI